MFNKTEIKYLIYTSLILGFIFSFREWGTEEFSPIIGTTNWLLYILIFVFSIAIHALTQKIIAKKLGASSTLIIWKAKQLWFTRGSRLKRAIPLGYILSLFLSFYSFGYIKFTGVFGAEIKQTLPKLKKKFPKLDDYEQGLIALSGSLANLILAFIFAILASLINIELSRLIAVNISLAIFTMLPFPSLNGIQVLFGSRVLYVMSLVFIIISYFLINSGSILLTILSSLIIAIIIGLIYFYNLNK